MKTFEWLTREELLNDSIWWNIYESSFPKVELESRKVLINALDKNIIVMGRYTQNNETIAISVIQPMHSQPFALLTYFAISHLHRGCSLGSRLFLLLAIAGENLVKKYSENYLGLVWEVENPDAELNPAEKVLKQRRVHFYQKQGAYSFNTIFIQPPIDGQHTVSMRLMYMATQPLDNQLENKIIQAIYFEKYSAVNHIKEEILLDLWGQCSK